MFKKSLFAAAVLAATCTAAAAGELESYETKLEKAVSKTPCMCTGKGLENNIGYLATNRETVSPGYVRHEVKCRVHGYTTVDSAYQGAFLCANFTVLQ